MGVMTKRKLQGRKLKDVLKVQHGLTLTSGLEVRRWSLAVRRPADTCPLSADILFNKACKSTGENQKLVITYVLQIGETRTQPLS
jgi:hypothetical protein